MSEIAPDDKDWTWVLERPCPDCGFDAATVAGPELGDRIRRSTELWAPLLAAPGAMTRPGPSTWSPTEYAAHVRDVHRVFAGRLEAMLEHDDPLFDNWDQDATALEQRYAEQDPADVAPELVAAAQAVASAYDAVPDDAWGRRGRRGNGSEFTTLTLGRYHLHDLVHHAWDVRGAAAAATVAAYEQDAVGYGEAAAALPEVVRERLDRLARRLGAGARVLEIGSGAGRDADHLESLGVTVRRTDITPAFVAMLRARGHEADVVDPLTDDLADPTNPDAPYDGVWANACLLHVARTDLPTVLARTAAATRAGGVLFFSVKAGDGETWSRHGRVEAPRRFVLWRADDLREVVVAAGWTLESLGEADGQRGERWLMVTATRRM